MQRTARLYHDSARAWTPRTVVVKPRDVMPAGRAHAAGALLHRPRATSSARWTALRDDVDLRRARSEEVERPGQFFVRELLGDSIIVTRNAGGRGPRVPQRLPPSRHAALHRDDGHVRRQHPVPVSRVDLRPRRPADRRAAHGRSAALPQGGLPAARASHADVWDGHIFLNLSRDAAAARDAARRPARRSSAPGGCRTCASATASSTTSRRTGS